MLSARYRSRRLDRLYSPQVGLCNVAGVENCPARVAVTVPVPVPAMAATTMLETEEVNSVRLTTECSLFRFDLYRSACILVCVGGGWKGAVRVGAEERVVVRRGRVL